MLAYYSIRLAWQSHLFHDVSTANDATPLWIPQLGMAIGTLILLIAFIDELWLVASGRKAAVDPGSTAASPARTE